MKKCKLAILLATAAVLAGGVIIASKNKISFQMIRNQVSNLVLERSNWHT